MLAILTALTLGAIDPCAPVEPAVPPDATAAAQYRAVAVEEAAAGDRESATVAWRLAAANDPRDKRARRELAALCREGARGRTSKDPLQEGMRLLDAERYREAADLLRRARRAHPGSDVALLEGICRFELGEDAEAARLLREAETDPVHRQSARLYLGLLALRGGAAREAATLFDSAAGNPALTSLAADLARSARWDGPVVASILLEGGYDSNVRLTTTQLTTRRSSNGDALAGLSAVVLARPFGVNGPFVRGAGALQQFSRLSEYDFRSVELASGARWWRGGTGLSGEYAFAHRTLGGSAYLTTHRLFAIGGAALGPVGISASWWGRFEDYAVPYGDYSGFAQRADGRVGLALGARAQLGAGWFLGRDDADKPELSWTEHGPRADLAIVLGPRSRLTVEAGIAFRDYHAFDPLLGVKAWERIVDGAAALEWDVTRHATLRVSLLARAADSNVDGYVYSKVVPSAAIGVMMAP